ncbi:acetyltransferase [Brevibacillus panacihumi W25]|uniref:Acetyltransferase n=1 Tax=Brevibacillus panacihumi W25 TaxID=1408254 RepID=V6LZ19_9BACL|nr:GNAT family N-acetyltransferase [Brevibacillus panacihumi]EST51716.1 acetyltransferase [Brevibacillus panacihumi W25]
MPQVRPATLQDYAAICRIDAMILGNTSRSQELHDAISAGHGYVASLDNDVSGFAIMTPSFYNQAFVSLLAVHPQHQRQGVGQALLQHLEKNCPTEKLFTSTNLSNKRMIHLCRKLNFVESGSIDNLNNDGDPELLFCKYIKKPQFSK